MGKTQSIKNLVVPLIMAVGMISGFAYFSSGITLWITFIPGLIIALFFYFYTYYQHAINSESVLPIYWLALAIQFFHFSEEYLGGFNAKFPALFQSPEYPIDLFVVFNMIAYSLFVLGGLIMRYKQTHLMLIPLFFIIFGTIGNAIAHLSFSIMIGGYFPGLYTSTLYWILGPLLIYRIWKARTTEKHHMAF